MQLRNKIMINEEYEDYRKQVLEKMKLVYQQKEEILTAFIAKYGCDPDEIEQVEWKKSLGETIWFVRKKTCDIKDGNIYEY